jgi:hypothetical protein
MGRPSPFRRLLSPESIRRIELMDAELARIHALDDRWLGEEILRLARRARQENPGLLADPRGGSYSPNLVWQVIPEVARRLGAKPGLNEATDREIVSSDDRKLRERVGHYLANSDLRYGMESRVDKGETLTAISKLEHLPCNGNPVAMAIDRICPPAPQGQDQDDPLARSIWSVGRYLDGVQVGAWSPAVVTRSDLDWSEPIGDSFDDLEELAPIEIEARRDDPFEIDF